MGNSEVIGAVDRLDEAWQIDLEEHPAQAKTIVEKDYRRHSASCSSQAREMVSTQVVLFRVRIARKVAMFCA